MRARIRNPAYSAFRLWVNTTLPGSASNTFVLPTPGTGTYDYEINWGDGATEHITSNASQTHVYSTPGRYQIAITGVFPQVYFAWGGDCQKVTRAQLGDVGWRSFEYAFMGCRNLAVVAGPSVTGAVTSFAYAWYACPGLTSFSALDTSAGIDFTGAWTECYSLTSFPAIDTSAGTTFYYTWRGCSGLTSFPALNLSAGTDFSYAWYGCYELQSFPVVDVSAGTNFFNAWAICNHLTSFPVLDMSAGTEFSGAWSYCSALTSFPALDVSSGIYFNAAWANCEKLTSFPALDTGAATDLSSAWVNCTKLASFPVLNTSAVTDFSFAWAYCPALKASFAAFDISKAADVAAMFTGCDLNDTGTTTNYDNTLVSWAAQSVTPGLSVNFGTSKYSNTGLAARNVLTGAPNSWTVVDGGHV
jgi:hypothetical protein